MFVSGLYGAARDALISRSKIVLNINRDDRSRIFEVVRVSYLLANRKAVLAVIDPDTALEPGMAECIMSTKAEDIIVACEHLLSHEAERAKLEEVGFEKLSTRDIASILDAALS